MSFSKSQVELDALCGSVRLRDGEYFELSDAQFNKLYWPLRDLTLQIIKISESILSRKMLYYSWALNRGVVVRRILIPQGYALSALPPQQLKSTTSTTNPSELFQSSIDAPTNQHTTHDESEFHSTIRFLMEVRLSLYKWRVLSSNVESGMQQLDHMMVESELLTMVQSKAYCSLEDLIGERVSQQQYFSV